MVTSPCLHRAFAVPSHPTKERIKEFEAAAERSKDLSNYVNRYPWWHGIGTPKCNPCNLIMAHLNFLNLSQTLEKKHENHWTSPDILEFFNSMPGVAQSNYKEHKAKSKKARMEWREWREHQNLSRMIILWFFWVWNPSSSKGFLVGKCQAHPTGPCQCMLLDTGMSENGVYTKKPQFINYLYWFVVIWSTNSSIFVYFYGIPPFVTPILMQLSAFQIDPNKFASVSVVQRREDGHSVIPTHLEESRTS